MKKTLLFLIFLSVLLTEFAFARHHEGSLELMPDAVEILLVDYLQTVQIQNSPAVFQAAYKQEPQTQQIHRESDSEIDEKKNPIYAKIQKSYRTLRDQVAQGTQSSGTKTEIWSTARAGKCVSLKYEVYKDDRDMDKIIIDAEKCPKK
jgi:hypothetical protein